MLAISKYVLCCIGLVAVTVSAAEPPEAMQHARASYELSKRGDLTGAAEQMRIAVRLAPENPLYLSALAGIASRQGKKEEAKQCWERAFELDPRSPALRSRLEEASLDLGADLAKQRRFKAGVILAESTVNTFPESARAQQMLAFFLMRNHQNPAAVEAYRKALSLSPESSDINVGLGIAQTMAGLLPQAVQTLEAGIRKWPADAMHYQAYGVLLLRMAEEGTASEDRGVQMLRKALALHSSLSEAHYQLGNLALTQGDASGAIEHLLTAIRNGDDGSKVHFALSRAYRAAGKMHESENHAELFRERKEAEAKQ